jgi:DHA1 family multidrug resistance protein-like MFS transporter
VNPTTEPIARRVLAPLPVLVAGVFVVQTGAFGIVPILPLVLRERGIAFAEVGLLVGVTLLTAFLGQYPAGRLGDRIGRRPMLVLGSLLYGTTSLGFILTLPIPALFVLRVAQGLAIAAFLPNANAMIADLATPERRGRAYGWMAGARIGGLTVGPAIGGLVAVFARNYVFIFSAVMGFVGAALMLALPRVQGAGRHEAADVDPAAGLRRQQRLNLLAICLVAGGFAVLFGTYETVWPLFMKHLSATDFQVGLSFSLFGLPFVLMTPVAGWAADRFDRRWLTLGAFCFGGLMALIYPSLHSIILVMSVGVLEAIALAFAEPAANAKLMEGVEAARRGRVQGTLLSVESGGQAIGALSGGLLFSFGPGVPFYVGAGLGFAGAALAALVFVTARRSVQSLDAEAGSSASADLT